MLLSMKYKINEIFKSLQGEGVYAGREVVFIRMAKCNLSCEWCDTDFDKYDIQTEEEIVDKVLSEEVESVIITGGEPTLQNLRSLLILLRENNLWVGLETNGTQCIDDYKYLINHIAVSPKKNHEILPSVYQVMDELKIVNDNISKKYLAEYNDLEGVVKYISPLFKDGVFNLCDSLELKNKINEGCDERWEISLQYHKILEIR